MISRKKYAKAPKRPPKGYKTANDFFTQVFKDKDMIWMGQNTNHLHNLTDVKEAMIDCINSGEYCKYPSPEGFPELKELILGDLDLDGFDILVTAGGTESLHMCMNDLLEPHHNVISPDPGYLIIDTFASRFCNEVRSIPIYNEECEYKLTPKLVKENMDENTRVIVLIDPLNPLGSSYTEEEIKEFAKIAKENDIYLLHDITYRDFAETHTLAACYAPENTVTVFSFSKIFGMAGLRIGAVISSPDRIQSIRTILINDLGTNIVSQAGGIAALKSKYSWINDIKQITRNNQKIIKDAVDKIEGVFLPVYPSEGNMMAIDISQTGINPEKLADYLLEKKVFIRQGSYTSRLFGDRYVRVSFSIPEKQVKIFAKEFTDAIATLRAQ